MESVEDADRRVPRAPRKCGLTSLQSTLAKLDNDSKRMQRFTARTCSKTTVVDDAGKAQAPHTMQQADFDLLAAAAIGDAASVDAALQRGANPNSIGVSPDRTFVGATALVIACRNGHETVVRRLLKEQGLDTNAGTCDEENQMRNHQSALIWASRLGHTAVIRELLTDPRVDVNARTEGTFTAFMIACQEGHVDAVEVMLQDTRIDVNALWKDTNLDSMWFAIYDQRQLIIRMLAADPRFDVNKILKLNREPTYLSAAVEYCPHIPGVVMALLHHKADPNVPDKHGLFPLDVSIQNHAVEIETLLLVQDAESSFLTVVERAKKLGDAARLKQLLADSKTSLEGVMPALHVSALLGDVAGVKRELQVLKDFHMSPATLPAVFWSMEAGHMAVTRVLLSDFYGFSPELIEELLCTIEGTPVVCGQCSFNVVNALISKGTLENPDYKEGAVAIIKPWCSSILALRFFTDNPAAFESIRELCLNRSTMIYERIDEAVTTPVLETLAVVGANESAASIRQDDASLLPAFKYLIQYGLGAVGEVGGNHEFYYAHTLSILGLALNSVFGTDMLDIFSPLCKQVVTAPSKTFMRMFHKLINTSDHGDPRGQVPRSAKNVDINRCCVTLSSWEDMLVAFEALKSTYRILRIKNTHSPKSCSHGGYRSLLVNFAYAPELTFREIFGCGHHSLAASEGNGSAFGHQAADVLAKKWLAFARAASTDEEVGWGLQALWQIAREEPERKVVIAAEVQIVYEPYCLGRAMSHLLFKLGRCETGAAEMVRDFHQEFYHKQSGGDRVQEVMAIAIDARVSKKC